MSRRKKILAVALVIILVLSVFAVIYTAPRPPPSADRDGDGCPNDLEVLWGLDPDDGRDGPLDPDGDGLTTTEECDLGTVPIDPDTDDDRLWDGEEHFGRTTRQGTFVTDPLDNDTDDDGAQDGREVLDFHRFDRIETEDAFAVRNVARYPTYVVFTVRGPGPSEAAISVELNIPQAGEYRVSVAGTGAVTYENLTLNATTFGLDDLSSDIIVNAPHVTVRRNVTSAAPLVPLRENRTWAHLFSDTQGTEQGIRLDQVRFRAKVSTFWVYAGDFVMDPGAYNLTLTIALPPDLALLDPQFRFYAPFISVLTIDTGFFRIWRRTISPLDPDVDRDTLLDGREHELRSYPLNPDPDEDGISDPSEVALGTNVEDRDTDEDGVRDAVELGFRGIDIDPYTPWDLDPMNADADMGATVTDPRDADSDGDGLPDGFVDGWLQDERKGWGRHALPDLVRQRWEGEDWDGDGLVDAGAWNQGQGPGETSPVRVDTDADNLPDAWEVWHLLDPTDATGEHGAAGNPDHDASVREHSIVRDTTTGLVYPYGRGQSFQATETRYDTLTLWAENRAFDPFRENLEVLLVGTRNGRPDTATYLQSVATLPVPVGAGELNITLGPHALTVGDTYVIWLRQASTVATGTLLLGLSTEGAEARGEVWDEQFGVFDTFGSGEWDLTFALYVWGGPEQLSNLGEYVAGTDPRDPDTDRDGAGDWPEAQVMYRTNVPRGGEVLDGYGTVAAGGGYEWIWYDGREYGFVEALDDPPAGHPAASVNNTLVALLWDRAKRVEFASSVVVSGDLNSIYIWETAAETTWHRTFFLWERTGRTYRWSSFEDVNGNGLIDARLLVYSVAASQGGASTGVLPELAFIGQEIYLSDPFDAHSDWDAFPDPYEPMWFQDVDGDGLANARDTDSDGDGVGDDNEARFIWRPPVFVPLTDVDGDGLDNLVDPDSDGDGVEDGLEYIFYMDYDWDGYRNMVDNDTDNDGLPDGWMDGYRYDAAAGTFLFNPIFQDGVAQRWEGEDFNGNGVFEPALGETDATQPDSDRDGLWDGYTVVVPIGRYEGTNVGELTVGTLPLVNDTDMDGVLDGTEVLGWLSGFWSPPRRMTSDPLAVNSDADALDDGLEFRSKMTDPLLEDTDGDGLWDDQEDANRNGIADPGETKPWRFDSDTDGLADGIEVGLPSRDTDPTTTTDPLNPDSDGDGLIDGLEDTNLNGAVEPDEADPNVPDSDGDGILDGPEYRILRNTDRDGDGFVNLRDPDSDNDLIRDGDDLWRYNGTAWVPAWFIDFDGDGWVNALDDDSDGDISPDGAEDFDPINPANSWNGRYDGPPETNPLDGDQDNDGLLDGIEITYQLDRNNPDTDGDGILDGYENGWDLDSDGDGSFNGNDTDSDDDGLSDPEEDLDFDGIFEPFGGDNGNETDPTEPDSDFDGLDDLAEFANGADPNNPDTDADGLWDGAEVLTYGTNVTHPHSDGDEYTDGDEVSGAHGYVMDPASSDTDADGLYDHLEVELGYNPTVADMDGDGLEDGADLQPLASWPDMYDAPADTRRTFEFRGGEYAELVDYGIAADAGTASLAAALDQARLIAPLMPTGGWGGAPIGTNLFMENVTAYSEGIGYEGSVLSYASDNLFQEQGYKVKFSPANYTQTPWEHVATVGTLPFYRSNFSITFDNFRPVPAPGGFFHHFFMWELTPGAMNTITLQFYIDPAYDESSETNTSYRAPGFGFRLTRYGGTFTEELLNTVAVAKAIGGGFYEASIDVPPGPSSALKFPTESHLVDLSLLWFDHAVDRKPQIDPLLPYRYQDAIIEFVDVDSTSVTVNPDLFSSSNIMAAGALVEALAARNLTFEDLVSADAILGFRNYSFDDLENDAVFQQVQALPTGLDWTGIRDAIRETRAAGHALDDILDGLTKSGRFGIDRVLAEATFRAWNPVQIVTVASITTVATFESHLVLPGPAVPVEDAVQDFEALGLDLETGPTGSYPVASGTLLFFNTRTASVVDWQTLANLAENGTGADILVLTAPSPRHISSVLNQYNWSGWWSPYADDATRTGEYLGNYSESRKELRSGIERLPTFPFGRGHTQWNVTTNSFQFVPGTALRATGNVSALPGPTAPEEFLFASLPPVRERWTIQSLDLPIGTLYETMETRYFFEEEVRENVLHTFSVSRQQYKYQTVLKKYDNVDDLTRADLSSKDAKRIRGIKIALGIAGVLIVWDTYRDAAVAYRNNDTILFALIVLEGVTTVAEITFTIVKIQRLAALPRVLAIIGVIIGVLFAAYFIYKATQANTGLEAEFYFTTAVVFLADAIIAASVYGAVAQVVVLGVTWVLHKFGVLPQAYTISGLVVALVYWWNGCGTPSERAEELEEIQGHLDDIGDWLEATLTSHADRGEIAYFIGGISLVKDAQDLADGGC